MTVPIVLPAPWVALRGTGAAGRSAIDCRQVSARHALVGDVPIRLVSARSRRNRRDRQAPPRAMVSTPATPA